MIPAPIPENEKERLADLHAMNLLDTPPEEQFDRVVQLAKDIFDMPITYIALVDADRQWFKAKCGLAGDQTGRSESFCGHTILQSEPLISPDALNDERFYDNPLVTDDPKVRFYAGYPLASAGGYNVATLCLVDTKPRQFSDQQLGSFTKLAQIAEQQLNLVDLVRTQRELLQTKNQLVQTQQRLNAELSEAAAYVESLLPAPLNHNAMTSGHRFISSSQLGGDTFGYDFLDKAKTQLAIYLLDVTGHGVGSSLLSVKVNHILQRRTWHDVDFSDPAAVLTALNEEFPMEENQGKFFTIWYGVYDTNNHQLTYATAGHHPAMLFAPGSDQAMQLGEPALMIGAVPESEYENQHAAIEPNSLMYLFSDGAFEVTDQQGKMLRLEGLLHLLGEARQEVAVPSNGSSDGPSLEIHDERLDLIVHRIRKHQGGFNFADDFSMLEVAFH